MEFIYEIAKLNNRIRKEFESRILPLGFTYPKWIVLKAIKLNEGLIASELMDIVQMDKATLSELLNRLEKEGLIIKKKSKQDKRISTLFLSERTLELCGEAMMIESVYLNELRGKITDEEMAFLLTIIYKL